MKDTATNSYVVGAALTMDCLVLDISAGTLQQWSDGSFHISKLIGLKILLSLIIEK